VTVNEIGRIAGVGVMSDSEFHDFELALVRIYRIDEESQERIAMALTAANLAPGVDRTTRERLDEIFAMLQHVHDPFITSGAQCHETLTRAVA
jgi:hypothetical protein